ncbi:hypothetical protein BO83DRAFT_458623 [Aspergillus eucalypticola CBS 122712]|uniref:Uncharacterized protein n=1 Tax=Aspergillus eucalypticola (strain CBS 122712 / IBT 29274) TaxID=1448314 RepID=A0A317UQ47_ASPEC|nr:uncharacterized protein BO83DRAFT_458623 [Aspergillus eucalypticola CBS 122712]PWY62572.1 hypothetical protein BO83DRAFT_458623 [Aspergillus eucalypticola CBS 122712]
MEGHDVDDQVARDDEENNNIHTERERLTRSRSTWGGGLRASPKLDLEYTEKSSYVPMWLAGSLGDHLTLEDVGLPQVESDFSPKYGDREPTVQMLNGLGRATGRSAQTVSCSSTNGSADWKHLVSRDA